ncbi:FAD-binding oxidoreductase [Nocardioides koreensis]|uniref:FAD-binding oxidoreductase n=1 Tax=Nocardioides koreensis TaxID=433651 RepID=A0ABP5LF80_9ACTN
MTAHRTLPGAADVVIVGGGVIGLSTAYHLARAGVDRVVLLERDGFGSGSTCKAAGGVRANFSDEVNVVLGLRSLEAFETFAADLDQEIDLHQPGYLFLIDNETDLELFRASRELHRSRGIVSELLDPEEARRLSPLISTEGLLAGLHTPRDGHCTPESVVLGYTRAARRAGATLVSGCEVTGIATEGDRITCVSTTGGDISTGHVICAAGAWSRHIGTMVGVDLPVTPLRRQLVVTEPVPGLGLDLPFTIDFTTSMYFHKEGPGLLLGMPEKADSWSFDLTRTTEWLVELAEAMQRRTPSLGDVGLTRGWAGLYEMTPDHNALIGRASSVPGFWYATGFSGHGFLMGPAVGEVMRDLYLGHTPFVDVSGLSADRFRGSDVRPEINVV